MRSIYLCGFMGCGKTTVGMRAAKLMELNFIDLDHYIVEREGMPIPEIFSRFGEAHFRALESETIADLSGAGAVIATGGGAMVSAENAKLARQDGVVVFLDLDFATCYERIREDTNRPLVQSNTKEQLQELYERRRVIYAANADIILNASGTPFEVARELARAVNP